MLLGSPMQTTASIAPMSIPSSKALVENTRRTLRSRSPCSIDSRCSGESPERYTRTYGCSSASLFLSREIIFSAAGLNFMTFNRFFVEDGRVGQVFVLFIMGIAAAEVAIALSIVIAIYRNYQSIQSADLTDLKG